LIFLQELRPLLARWLLLFIVKLGVKLLDEDELCAWVEHGSAPAEAKASALERDVWQVIYMYIIYIYIYVYIYIYIYIYI